MPTRPPRAYPQGQPTTRSLRACTRSGCPNLTERGLCTTCRSATPPRPTARQRGYSTAWEKARAGFLAKHPFCECPLHKGKPDAPRSDTVDHIVAHKGNKALFWEHRNWQASTRACNARKAVLEEGAFGQNGVRANASTAGGG